MQSEILCVGVNPAYQTTLHFKSVQLGKVNRAFCKTHSIGGKGQNAAIAIRQLDTRFKVSVLQLIGGETGQYICNALAEKQITQHNVLVQRKNRTCTTLLDLSQNLNTELVEPSELVYPNEYHELLKTSLDLISSGKFVAIAICGTLPMGVDSSFYNELTLKKPNGCCLLMDAYRDVNMALDSGNVDILKINIDEALELASSFSGRKNHFKVDIIELGFQILSAKKIHNLVITDGHRGAALFERKTMDHGDIQILCTTFCLPDLGFVLESLRPPQSPQHDVHINTQLGKLRDERPSVPSPLSSSPALNLADPGLSSQQNENKLSLSNSSDACGYLPVPLNTLGAGDTCSGVLLATYLETGDIERAVKRGLAAASASCVVTESTSHFELGVMDAVFSEIKVTRRKEPLLLPTKN